MGRKYFKHAESKAQPKTFFRHVYKTGNSKGVGMTKIVKDWRFVKIVILEESENKVVLSMEKMA